MKVVCLGDSLTGPAPGALYLDQYVKWSDLLRFGLETILGAGNVEVLNQGKAGDPAAGARGDLDARLLSHRPDIAVVLLGANDFSPERAGADTPARFREDLRGIVRRGKGAGIRILLLQYPDPRAENMEKVWAHANAGNPIIAEIGAEEGVPVLPLKPAFDAAARTLSLATLANPVDGIHLNPGGELVLARAVLEKLRSLGWISAAA